MLDESGWIATELRGEEIGDSTTITLMLVSSQFTGEIGCVVYDGAIQTTPGGRILELRTFGGHDGACEGRDRPRIAPGDYLSTLESAASYRLSPDRLELLDERGDPVLAFRPGIPDGGELAGTDWQLNSLDGAGLIEGTAITMAFSGTWLTGDSGCNGYGGQYMLVEPGVISLPGIVSEAEGCVEPPGILDQETAYQNLLCRIVAYRLTDSRLELLDAAGAVRLVFERS